MPKAAYFISVGGQPVTAAFAPVLISLEITDSDGDSSDTLDIELNDTGGQIALPAAGSAIEARLWWEQPPPYASGGAAQFIGVTDEAKSKGARGAGRTLSISAKATDLKGKGKHKFSKHVDQASFNSVAQQFGQVGGYSVSVDPSLASIQRDYWVIANESFLSWGRRIAAELGATFKAAYPKAVFIPRNSSASASGAALGAVNAVWGQNLISWELAPALSRGVYANSKAHWYDIKAAKWQTESVPVGGARGAADLTHTFKHASKDRAHNHAQSGADDSKRHQGSGSVEIDGDSAAQSQATLNVSGARPGIDGGYTIKTAKQHYSRRRGWITQCAVELPSGAAGQDSR